MDEVVVRLEAEGVVNTPLQREWSLIAGSDRDDYEFATAAARLGEDPYNASDSLVEEILSAAEMLDPSLLSEFLDSVDPSNFKAGLAWVEKAQKQMSTSRRPPMAQHASFLSRDWEIRETPPWEVGYEVARSYRAQAAIRPEDRFDIASYVATSALRGPAAGLEGLVSADPDSVGLVLPSDRHAGASARHFASARALGLSLLSDRRLILLDPAHTDLAKASRAFAAEILAPADGIRSLLDDKPTTAPPAFESIARRFGVSPLVVERQYANQISG